MILVTTHEGIQKQDAAKILMIIACTMEWGNHRKTMLGPCFIQDQGRYIYQFCTLSIHIRDITKNIYRIGAPGWLSW